MIHIGFIKIKAYPLNWNWIESLLHSHSRISVNTLVRTVRSCAIDNSWFVRMITTCKIVQKPPSRIEWFWFCLFEPRFFSVTITNEWNSHMLHIFREKNVTPFAGENSYRNEKKIVTQQFLSQITVKVFYEYATTCRECTKLGKWLEEVVDSSIFSLRNVFVVCESCTRKKIWWMSCYCSRKYLTIICMNPKIECKTI